MAAQSNYLALQFRFLGKVVQLRKHKGRADELGVTCSITEPNPSADPSRMKRNGLSPVKAALESGNTETSG